MKRNMIQSTAYSADPVLVGSRQPAGLRVYGVPLLVVLFFIGIMMPPSASISLGELRLSAYRVLLILSFMPMLLMLLSGRHGKPNIVDLFVGAHCVWALLALIKWGGPVQGIESGGIYIVECGGAYLLGRVFIRSLDDFQALAKVFVAAVCLLLLFTIPEAVTGVHILHDGFAAALGGPMAHHIDPRLGLERTFGPFDHPILYGVFSAAALSCAFYVVAEGRLTNFGGMAQVLGVLIATFLSASGGPYVVALLQLFVAGWEKVLNVVVGRWHALFTIFGLTYVSIDLLSTRTPFHVFVTYLTFSTTSAYNRINIWIYGTAEVGRNPLFGIGLGDWIRAPWMSDSMDNFWLLITVRYGLPALFFLVAALLCAVVASGRRKALPQSWRNARHAWAFTMFGIAVAAGTVHLWNALFVLFMFLIGSGAWLMNTRPAAMRHRPVAARAARRPTLF